MLIDTHCHLGDPAFDADRDRAVEAMHRAGVARAVVIESILGNAPTTLGWLARHPGLVLATGCHPHEASRWSNNTAAAVHGLWAEPLVRAAGEMGLDYHYDHSPRHVQQRAFDEQAGLAVEAGLPIVIHAREADDDVVAILRGHPDATVILHSFSSGPALRDAGLDAGWYFSFSGMVTFRSWSQGDTVRAVPADRLLVETDSPYLAPVPHRGQRNQPAYVREVVHGVAALRAESVEQVIASTGANATRLFWPNDPDPVPEQ
ncbi:MAG: TatD family hydrolase [Gemmatimonadales bacterium]